MLGSAISLTLGRRYSFASRGNLFSCCVPCDAHVPGNRCPGRNRAMATRETAHNNLRLSRMAPFSAQVLS
jgi:hypothetical protein